IESKILITMIVAVFPVLVNVIVGLRAVDPDRIALIRSLKGGVWSEFVWVRLPSAAPFIFAGMKTAVVLSLLGAIAAEFVGAEAGLGYLMSQLMFRLDTPGVFAILLLLGVIGVTLYLIADWAHRKVVFWDASNQDRWAGK
ncbi:MAG: ABC transporter permease, partial [Lautropia sp.]